MTLDDIFDLPADVITEFSKGVNNWMNHVRVAVKRGVTNLTDLTDLVFFLHHPERLGKKIEAWESEAAEAWKDFRRMIAREFPGLMGPSKKKKKETTAELNKKLDEYISYLEMGTYLFIKPQIWSVLRKIKDKDRRLLALFGYIRFQHNRPWEIYDIWAWDDSEIAAYKKSAERAQAKKDIQLVKRAFNSDSKIKSKGFRLSAAPRVRSLQSQITLWNRNGSVKTIGKKLRKVLIKEMKKPVYSSPPDEAGIKALIERLTTGWKKGTLRSPTNATPGLSSHGQMRAIDFHVKNGGAKVAHSGNPKHWRDSGFDAALRRATDSANRTIGRKAFKGPLVAPDEPWHYTYVPL